VSQVPKPRGKSRQDYQTPRNFLAACEERFGSLTWDVAADGNNSVVPGKFFSRAGLDAFTADWRIFTRQDLLWANVEFAGIGHAWAPLIDRWTRELPWLRILLLTPAALGSEWYRKHVEDRAMVLPLNPRLTFVGEKEPYPKDLMLSCFGFGVTGVKQWRWEPLAADKRAERKRARAALKAA
jgi:hypothetical protein